MREATSRFVDPETIETRITVRTSKGELRAVSRTTRDYAGWLIEHPVKRFPEDLETYSEYFLAGASSCDLSGIAEAIEGVGDKGIVTPCVGDPFTSYLCGIVEGGVAQAITHLLDHGHHCKEIHVRYVEVLAERTRHILENTNAEAIFVNGGYAALPMVSPALFREWDRPVLEAVGLVCREYGVPLHLHQHGPVWKVMDDIVEAGVNLVCPLLPPPQGDVEDLGLLSHRYGHQIALKGNVDPIEVLLKGTPDDVEREVRRCIDAAAGQGGFILGTADSTVAGTPFENIHAFVEAGRKYGQSGGKPGESIDRSKHR